MQVVQKRLPAAIAGLVLAGMATGLAALHGGTGPIRQAAADTVPAAPAVDVAAVVARPITEWQSYSGRLEAIDKVDVRPLASGRIVAVHFRDGALVKAGDTLFTIDPRPYAAEVERAAAQLTAAETRAAYAASDSARADRLLESNAIARREFDEKQNAAREAAANLQAAKAALGAARINLDYTRVTAPVAGRVSRAELTVGNIVSAGANAPLLTTLVSVSPIYASFNVDEQTYLRYLRQSGRGTVPVSLGLADEAGYSRQGAVASVDNRLDTSSGTIRVRARFDNTDGTLLPGLYARLKVGAGTPRDAVLVDDAAIGTDQAKKFVYVVDAQNKVQYREIVPGNMHEGLRIVASGLQAGERIVVNGTQRARPNEAVAPRTVDMLATARSARPAA
jgi:multidrug efflux system membrane fusion protein